MFILMLSFVQTDATTPNIVYCKVWPVSNSKRNNSKQQAANNMQQGMQTDSASNNVGSGWPTMMCPFGLRFKKIQVAISLDLVALMGVKTIFSGQINF